MLITYELVYSYEAQVRFKMIEWINDDDIITLGYHTIRETLKNNIYKKIIFIKNLYKNIAKQPINVTWRSLQQLQDWAGKPSILAQNKDIFIFFDRRTVIIFINLKLKQIGQDTAKK